MSLQNDTLVRRKDGEWQVWRDNTWQPYVQTKKNVPANNKPAEKAVEQVSKDRPHQRLEDHKTASGLVEQEHGKDRALAFTQAVAPKSVPTEVETSAQLKKNITENIMDVSSKFTLPAVRHMVDVQRPVVSGPLDELRFLSIDEFHHLGATTEKAIDRLTQKFQVLSEESFDQSASALRAWRQSPLYQAHLTTIVAALNTGKSIEAVLQETKAFTKEEFLALINFNRTIRA
ncbi:hypothetical protein COV04_00165 [Candidatus Uhrbacteria bacterium CG10_big_fil_rev_8_21_14_0_10_48_11]|uniref:Uncharacterized protein n=1 Tax=Candidatus Uhrbacteria bacterium CG10_big_fil_rev_8_21_14_0_10_48_11 TaxID=1975037 RepID=A0A2M8LFQ2_9BACT|nr:MAG: hypothetical protein COV04_00165 [Candidatus Uhrbacteria bacterium CG10_big_fil_rev_8_21_14_0_10_48_11]